MTDAAEPLRRRGIRANAYRALRTRIDVIISCGWILAVLAMAILPEAFTSTDYLDCDAANSRLPPQGPSGNFPLGTNSQGCDYYAMTIAGARPSILLAAIVITATLLIAFVLGSLAGYYGGWIDAIVSRTVEVYLAVPFFLGALLLLTLFQGVSLGSGQVLAIIPAAIALTLFGWTSDTRLVRASVLRVKNFDFVQAARALGASDRRLLTRHILPHAVAPVVAGIPVSVGAYITTEATLSAIGLGVRPPATSWGRMIAEGAPWASGGYPHLLLVPGIALLLTIFAFALVGDALRDALDPKLS